MTKYLFISNQAVRNSGNNSKTLYNIVTTSGLAPISQLLFSGDNPSSDVCDSFYALTDRDMLRRLLRRSANADFGAGNSDRATSETISGNKGKAKSFVSQKNYFFRLLREAIWANERWKTSAFQDWIDRQCADVVFFMAGDCVFAYEITNYIIERTNAKLIVYITDDYILPRTTISPFFWMRRGLLHMHLESILHRSDHVFVISPKMKACYEKKFDIECKLLNNMSAMTLENSTLQRAFAPNEAVVLSYFGGLHLNRWKTILEIAVIADRLNLERKRSVQIHVYSNDDASQLLNRLSRTNSVVVHDSIPAKEVPAAISNSDALLFVESFDRWCRDTIRLSLSTKVFEYLSSSKPIVAIGPSESASISFLEQASICATSINGIEVALKTFLFDSEAVQTAVNKAEALMSKSLLEQQDSRRVLSSYIN